MNGKKVIVILGLLLVGAFAIEKKIDLNDIERDNLRAESKSDTQETETDESSYGSTSKPEVNQAEYPQEPHQYEQPPQQYQRPQQYQNVETQPEEYQQDAKYSENEVYHQTPQTTQYAEYQQREHVDTSGRKYETPQQQELFYQQPEVAVGNRYQSVQQKAAAAKYGKNANKGIQYVNIPTAQLLSYYPNLAVSQPTIAKSDVEPFLHRLATEAAQRIRIPIYDPSLSREPVYAASKVAYDGPQQYVTFGSKYPKFTQAILPTKSPKKLIYGQSLLSHQQQSPRAQVEHYLQEIVYTQPGAVYAQSVAPSHTDDYARPSVYLQGNSLGQSYASQAAAGYQHQYAAYTQPESYYTLQTATFVPQLGNQIYQQQGPEHYEALPESPDATLDLPRLPAQNFKSSGHTNEIHQTSSESVDSHYSQNHLTHSSEPKSLLDSYIPSRLIAAQDAERYREIPIRLESGFQPSKLIYSHSYKKRKAE